MSTTVFAETPSLDDAVEAPVRACRASDTLRVPLGRSGVDLVPLFANGYALTTQDNSHFDREGLEVEFVAGQDLPAQVESFLRCETPILRATQGQLQLVAELTAQVPGSDMVAIYHHGWSSGADHLVARDGLVTPEDLSGKRIAIGAFSPQLDLLAHLEDSAQRQGLRDDAADWVSPELVFSEHAHGLYDDSPGARFFDDERIDAALMGWDDALVLTSGGERGTGAEGSVAGAHIPLSTRSASRVVSHAYVVRRDYLEANRDQVERFIAALFGAEEVVRERVATGVVDWDAVAEHVLGDAAETASAETLWSHVETVGLQGNVNWANPDHPRSFASINRELGRGLQSLGLISQPWSLEVAALDYGSIAEGIFDQRRVALPDFDQEEAARVIDQSRADGNLDERTVTRFTITFDPNQTGFPAAQYADDFDEVIGAATRYGGAVFTVEGHADPLKYLQRRHEGAGEEELRAIRQSTENLSLSRAREVRESLVAYADREGVMLDESQFVTEGRGLHEPATGLCDGDPCPPQTEAEWRSNMRVVVRAVRMEAESSAFSPPHEW
ncbi:nitrate ABC transporter substrate-binding protein [Halomonas sp. ML-15]|uniref:nitrate ABC transporter substrate-binding protein n=1 Tax=Halomonas sp. ML-15 TaxID=2773305 RepID=UPI0017467E17|nr:nitrate ABC transporter substrate-binding protein [Halomonas sp. ML-15]MBD3895513.1 nitrate ABC transporter substrate-binding protein [Halomonas sp. ML-15]